MKYKIMDVAAERLNVDDNIVDLQNNEPAAGKLVDGDYYGYAVSYTPDGGKTWTRDYYVTDSDGAEVSKTTHGNNYSRVCEIFTITVRNGKIKRNKI